MYGKLYAQTFTGSMYGAGPQTFAVWCYCIANAGTDSMVELNPQLVAGALGMSPEGVKKAIEYLCAPDPSSRTQDQDGRRLLQQAAFSYLVINHNHYRGMRTAEDRREYFRHQKRKQRQKERENKENESTVADGGHGGHLVDKGGLLSSVSASEEGVQGEGDARDLANRWLVAFGKAWATKMGQLAYGQGDRDARAVSRLAGVLDAMGPDDRDAAWEARSEMFRAYFKSKDKAAKAAGYGFAFFEPRFHGLLQECAQRKSDQQARML